MKHATLPSLRNDAMRRHLVHSVRFTSAELVFFRAQVAALRSLKDSDAKLARDAKQAALKCFLPFEEALHDLSGAGMGQEAIRLMGDVAGRIRRGRLAFLEHRCIPLDYADLVPSAVRLVLEGGES